jgi:hypothetical protein
LEQFVNLVREKYTDQIVVKAKSEIQKGNYVTAWKHLEDAHIFSQPDARVHIYVHCVMLTLALKLKNYSEVAGQLLRIILAGPSSVFKKYPIGNNGRSYAGLFESSLLPKRIEIKMQQLEKLELIRKKSGGELPKYQRKHPRSRG